MVSKVYEINEDTSSSGDDQKRKPQAIDSDLDYEEEGEDDQEMVSDDGNEIIAEQASEGMESEMEEESGEDEDLEEML